jgi:alpha-D-ribose 1-methylphosphonate 5-triphosphate synthase subunit PhnG
MYQFQDLTQADCQAIFGALMELPAKVANPILQKLDAQLAAQMQAELAKAAAQVQATAPTIETVVADENSEG